MLELGGWLDDACKDRQLPDPHLDTSGATEHNKANSAMYLRVVCSRLKSLGYLDPNEATTDILSPTISKAITEFQLDAGFSGTDVDGWSGPKTFRRLQQLVSFEEEQNPATWGWLGEDPGRFPALCRAVYLRLYTLGFGWEKDIRFDRNFDFRSHPDLPRMLSRFLANCEQLGLCSAGLDVQIDFATLKLIYDQDSLGEALAKHPAFSDDSSNRQFVDAVGRVELWLHGYDIEIGKLKPKIRPNGTIDQVNPRLAPLTKFWSCFPPVNGSNPPKTGFTNEFFAKLLELDKDSDPDSELIVQNSILQQAKLHGDSFIEKLKSLASRAWDGIKRAWNWLKHLVTKAAGAIDDVIWNLARLVARGAREAYATVVKAVEIVERGTVYLTKSVFPGSDPSSAVLSFDGDLDARLFIAENARGEHLKSLLDSDALHTRCFSAACRILAILLDAVGTVLQALVKPVVGWLTALLGLSRIVRDILSLKDIIEQFDFSNQEAILRTREG